MGKWADYIKSYKNREAFETVKIACRNFETTPSLQLKTALDLGCGSGGDTVHLIQNRFKVTALDGEPKARKYIRRRCKNNNIPQPQFMICNFEDMHLPEQYDLVNASLALPFVSPKNFQDVWTKVVQSIKPKGRFAGHFFGTSHAWLYEHPEWSFFTYDALIDLFKADFSIDYLYEERTASLSTFSSGKLFWHEWDIVATKKVISPERPLALPAPPLLFSAGFDSAPSSSQGMKQKRSHKKTKEALKAFDEGCGLMVHSKSYCTKLR